MRYYLYQHRRSDTNQVFYIGVGTKPADCRNICYKSIYKRAFTKSSRNFIWHRIVNKAGFDIDVIREFDSIESAMIEETRLIKFYGRIIDKTGTLANLIESDSEREEKRIKNMILAAKKRCIPTYKYSLSGRFVEGYESMSVAAKFNNTLPTDIMMCMKGRKLSAGGFMWRKFKSDDITPYSQIKKKLSKSVKQYTINGELVKEWESSKKAAMFYNVQHSAIRNNLSKISYSCVGYIWRYSDDNPPDKIDYKLKVYDKEGNYIGGYNTLNSAERDLKLSHNIISVYIRRGMNHPKYNFVINDIKTKKEKDGNKCNKTTSRRSNRKSE